MREIYNKFKSPIVTNSLWNIGGKVATVFISPIFTILIARILQPDDYGVYGIAFAIIAFIDIVKDLGISQAIIIQKEENDYVSLQFTLQLVLGVILYGIIFLASPYIADFYRVKKLPFVLNLYALIIFIWVIEFPLVTDYLKDNNYKLLFYRQIIPSIFFGLIAFILALLNFGVYSLVLGQLSSRLITALFLLLKTVHKPRLYFHYQTFKKLFVLGKHILIQSFSGFLVSSADSLVIGKNLDIVKLGFYRMAMRLTNLIPNALVPQVQQVVFTDISNRQNDLKYIDKRYMQFNLITGALAILISVCTFSLSPFLIPIILGEKWNSIIPIIQILSITLPTGMLTGINNDLSKILGFNHKYSYFSSIRSVITIGALFIGSFYSLSTAVFAWAFVALAANIINDLIFFRSQRIIKYPTSRFYLFVIAWVWITFVILEKRYNV